MPKSGDGFIDFLGQVHKTKEQFGQDGPITVHCRYDIPSLFHLLEFINNRSPIFYGFYCMHSSLPCGLTSNASLGGP